MEDKLVLYEEDIVEETDLKKNNNINSVNCLDIEKKIFFNKKNNKTLNKKINLEEQSIENIFLLDMYNLLYKDKPIIKDIKSMKKSYDVLNNIIRNYSTNNEFEELKKNTTFNSFASIISSQIICDDIINKNSKLFNIMHHLNQTQKNIDAFENTINWKREVYNKMEDNPTKQEIKKDIDEQTYYLSKFQKDLQQYSNELDKLVDNNLESISDSTDYLIKQTNEKLNSISTFLNKTNTGSIEDNAQNLDKDTINVLCEIINNDKFFKYFIKIIGSMRAEAIKCAKQKISFKGYVIKDVVTGNNISNLLSSEKIFLANEKTKKTFYKNYTEKNLLQYNKTDLSSQGPIIICRDCSGSMNIKNRNAWTAAFCVATLQNAKIQKRNLRIVDFRDYAISKDYLYKNNNLLIDTMRICRTKVTGGTNFNSALHEAYKAIDTSKFNDADIIFITDGESTINKKDYSTFEKIKKRKKVNMYTICIRDDSYSDENDRLNNLSDKVYKIYDKEIDNGKDIEFVFKEVFKSISEKK